MKSKRNINKLFFAVLLLSLVFFMPLVSSSFGDWVKSKITGRATTQPVSVNITIGNTAPTIVNVNSISAVTAVEESANTFNINFTAFDTDGFGNLKTVGATANVTKSGEAVRSNSSCIQTSTFDTNYANYSCRITMWYFDTYGTWNVGVSVNDTSNAQGFNTTYTFEINQLTAFKSSPSAITFPGIGPGATNTSSNNDPLLLNNTGNDPISLGSIELNATNLIGETDGTKALYAANFSVGIVTGSSVECSLTTNQTNTMSASVYTSLNNATLPNGNHSVNDGSSAQEQLYVCLRLAGSELSAQSYSTSNQGSWTLRVS